MTTNTESMVNRKLLEKIIDWADGIEEFQRHHAVDGLFHAKGFSVPPFHEESEGFFLQALDFAFWFWIDDRSDRHLTDNTLQFDWNHIIDLAEGNSSPTQLGRPLDQEENFYIRLSNDLEQLADNKIDHDHWKNTVSRVARAMYFEERIHRNGQIPSYIECIEYCMSATAVPNYIATASLIQKLNRATRQKEMLIVDIERCFAIQQRLLNDLHSAYKERQEGENGKTTNLVLLLERKLGPEEAETFVKNDYSSVTKIINSLFGRIGYEDSFVKLIQNSMKNINEWYGSNPPRYKKV